MEIEILDNQNGSPLIKPNRPLTLLDKRVITHEPMNEFQKPIDGFGRSSSFCLDIKQDTNEHLNNHYSSKRRKPNSSNLECASLVLEQFLAQHYNVSSSFESRESSDNSHPSAQNYFIDDYENETHNLLLW
jgi:hypothetical protein